MATATITPEPEKKKEPVVLDLVKVKDTEDYKILNSLGVPLCPKCGSKKLINGFTTNEKEPDKLIPILRCAYDFPDCEFIK